MTHVSRAWTESQGRPLVLCDFSPPRGADPELVEQARRLPAHFLCVAYSPGKSVRVDSAIMAYLLRQAGKDVVFNLACRDANKLLLQNHLLGAHLLGLENVLVVQGDEFTEKEREQAKGVNDYTPTGLIAAIKDMNRGVDYRGLKLRAPTDFCVGATLDLGHPLAAEAARAQRRVEAGADFFVTQPFYDLSAATRFQKTYRQRTGSDLAQPIFYGLQVLDPTGLVFGDVPAQTRKELDAGRPGKDIALEQLHRYLEAGLRTIYLVPPILKGGRRDYDAARRVLEELL